MGHFYCEEIRFKIIKVEQKNSKILNDIRPARLQLELISDYLSSDEKSDITQYRGVRFLFVGTQLFIAY
ncbi:hypothetical protein [Alkalibacterium subtropicum]|uniref:hypothetical protein n=1 Tax=Alkalibacterium subtropicum TaxID=753702 RepID=UPI0011603338|nr:hypothetical protein [Alkalibacterium subtropicum]